MDGRRSRIDFEKEETSEMMEEMIGKIKEVTLQRVTNIKKIKVVQYRKRV